MPNKFYITTAIPYVNAKPHLGFALEIIQADVLARYLRLSGNEVFFLTGTDENSFKIARAAIEKDLSPKNLADENSSKFYELKKVLNLSFDDFIRTTEERHKRGAQKFWNEIKQNDIYSDTWTGWYCVGCEAHYQKEDLIDGNKCPEHLKPLEYIEEKNYFFKIDSYKDKIKSLIESDALKIIPDKRKNEILNLLDKFHDFNTSRNKKYDWGISVPGDDSQIIYPWVEALTSYINGVGYFDDSEKFKKWWEDGDVRIIHIIGKGITKFHAIYWPAMLLSAGLRLPNLIFAHGYLTVDGQKISKSLGNVINPDEVVEKYGVDPVRYYLLREIPSYEDGDYSDKKLEARYNADLANNLGNLISRVAVLIEKFFKGSFSYHCKFVSKEIDDKVIDTWKKYNESINNFKLHIALENIFSLADFANLYIDQNKPWALSDNPERLNSVITNLVVILLNIAWLLKPFLPETSDKIFEILGTDKEGKSWEEKPFRVKPKILFPKLNL